ncbi:MAG: aldehyde dehydrogenase family protein [Rhizobiaceae bacterium]|nr:aldehyde dehydrogenase family protein [Rhizobiaceae bacterium]
MDKLNTTYGHFIGGNWQAGRSGKTFFAAAPATGEILAELAEGNREDARAAIASARAAFPVFSRSEIWDRSRLCHRIADEIVKNRDGLAMVLSNEQGKPLTTEAYGEIDAAATGFREAGELIKWMNGEVIPTETPGKRVISYRQPRGIYAVVTPWNFPINIPVEYLAPAIAAGNCVVWAPAPTTSLCAVKLCEIMSNAGLPDGVVNMVMGPGAIVGDEFVSNKHVNGIGFTGSPQTGQKIAQRGAGKPMLLELGGNGPVIILDDADLDKAAEAAAFGSFFNAGQVCAATGRILVTKKTHDGVVERLEALANKVVLGPSTLPNTTMGPLNNEDVLAKVQLHIADASCRGADVVCGGANMPELGSELYFEPTVVTNVSASSLLNTAETFGPVAPVILCDDEDHMLEVANAAEHGLAASVFTENLKAAHRFGDALQTGIVNINAASCYWELHIPFGGASGKNSGIGRLGGSNTLREMTDVKTVIFDLN